MAGRRGHRGFGWIRKLPSGRYQASFTAPSGKRVTAPSTFAAKEDAEGWLARRRNEIADGEWSPGRAKRAPAPTLEEYARAWLERRNLKPRTREHYGIILDKFIIPTFGPVRIRDITPEDVAQWYHALGRETGATYRSHAYGVLRTICNTAVREEVLTTNPCKVERTGAKRLTDVPPPTVNELRVMVANMPENLRAAVLVAAWAGLRFGELFELRRRDVDLNAGVIHVRRAVTRVGGEAVVGQPKTFAGRRDVNIPPHVVEPLRDHLREHAQVGRDGLVFPGPNGAHMAPRDLYRYWWPARQAADRPDVRWHDLRHFSATMAARSGATVRELQSRLGHSTAQAALRYQHASSERDAAIAARLSELAGE